MKLFLITFALIALTALVLIIVRQKSSKSLVQKNESVDTKDIRNINKLVEPFAKRSILIKTNEKGSTSYFGGYPPQFPGFKWPHRDSRPMSFLACVDLSQLPGVFDWLPKNGCLLFFYDMEEQPWGFDPKDRGGWAVLHFENSLESDLPKASAPAGLKSDYILNMRGMQFESTKLPPSWEEDALLPLQLTDAEQDELIELRSSLYGEGPSHQIGGYPDPVQSPRMALECQLASNGLYCGDSTGYRDPRAEQLKSGAKDWRLLLQMDSDDSLNVMWGDLGMIYFWVRESDAKQGDFTNAWLVLQCH